VLPREGLFEGGGGLHDQQVTADGRFLTASARAFYERHGWRATGVEAAPAGAVEVQYHRGES
jgi:hypothetical protein